MKKKKSEEILFRGWLVGLIVFMGLAAVSVKRDAPVLTKEVYAQRQITRPYCCNGDPRCSAARTCTANGDRLTISAGMGLFSEDCLFSAVDNTSTGLRVLEARLQEYDASGGLVQNEEGQNGSWILEEDLDYCTGTENIGVRCETGDDDDPTDVYGFICEENYAARTIDCTLDLSKPICWRVRDVGEDGEDQCMGLWQKDPRTVRIEVNLVYDDINRQTCCENQYCYFCSCGLTLPTSTPTPTPPTTPTPTPTTTPPPQTGSLSFEFRPEGLAQPPGSLPAVIVLRLPDGSVRNLDQVLANDGGVYVGRLTGLSPGNYDLTVKSFRHLSKKYSGTVIEEAETLALPESSSRATAGDAVNDNLVDVLDITAVVDQLDRTGDPMGLSGDVDYDGVVTILDLTAVIDNLDKEGERL